MIWSPRKNAPAPTVEDLRASADTVRREMEAMSAEAENIRQVLPELVTDPAYAAKAEARLRELDVLLPSKSRALADIEAAIPKAERVEELTALEAERLELDRRTAKLTVGLRDRYERAATQFASVLADMGENATEWAHLRLRAEGSFGVRIAGQDAETRLRTGVVPSGPMGWVDWSSLHETALVTTWDGRTLFEGVKVPSRTG